MDRIKVGILALQGAFIEHESAVQKCGASSIQVRTPGQLEEIDGLIIPGGESTTIEKLMKKYKFYRPLDDFYKKKKPIFGTCAGLIILAENIDGKDSGLGYININVERNAYGRQIDSFEEFLDLDLDNGSDDSIKFKSIFIRAPKISGSGEDVKILAKLKGETVLAQYKNILVCAFHPELTEDLRIHKYFIEMIKNSKREN
jgi:5'-phosphate synthase pdxT subunit